MKNLNRQKTHHVSHGVCMVTVFAALMTGCASAPPPVEQMAVSRAAVTSANSAGANEFSPTLLKSTEDKMAAAERAMTKKDYTLAQQLAEQAQVDAQLAVARTQSAKAQKAAEAVQEDSRALRNEIDRKN